MRCFACVSIVVIDANTPRSNQIPQWSEHDVTLAERRATCAARACRQIRRDEDTRARVCSLRTRDCALTRQNLTCEPASQVPIYGQWARARNAVAESHTPISEHVFRLNTSMNRLTHRRGYAYVSLRFGIRGLDVVVRRPRPRNQPELRAMPA